MKIDDVMLGMMAMLLIVAASLVSSYLGVDIDAGAVTMTVVTAIAAFVRGDRGKSREGDKAPSPNSDQQG